MLSNLFCQPKIEVFIFWSKMAAIPVGLERDANYNRFAPDPEVDLWYYPSYTQPLHQY